MRSNAWLCLDIILDDHPITLPVETLLCKSDLLSEPNIELILTTISRFKSLEQTQRLIKQTLSEMCHFETNIHFLHYSIIFIIDHCQIDSNADILLLSNLARALHRRHSILYLLIQFDKQEKHFKLTEKVFRFMSHMLVRKAQHAVKHPIEIQSNDHADEQSVATTQTHLVLPSLNDEQINTLKQVQALSDIKEDFSWSVNTNKQYIEIDSTLVELLLIFLAYYDFTDQHMKNLNDLASALQQFFLSTDCTPCFTTIRQFNRPVPVKQSQAEVGKLSSIFTL
jgi:hypothetical protein